MKIKTKLSLQFSIIVASILTLFTFSIYYFSEKHRENDFFNRLNNRAMNTAKLLISVKEVDAALMQIIDKNTLAMYDEEVCLYNNRYEKIYSSQPNNIESHNVLSTEIIQKLNKKKSYEFEKNTRAYFVSTYIAEKKTFIVMASAFDKHGKNKISNLRVVLLIGWFLSILITIIASLFYSSRAMEPISKVVKEVKDITASNLNSRVSEGNGKDEIAELAVTFNKMLERLESSFDMQKNFVSNASHEFRTPFTLILGEIELLLMQERSSEEYKKAIIFIESEIKSLNNLSNALLELAQLSAEKAYFQFSKLRIDELLFEIIEEKTKSKESMKIHFDFEEIPQNFECLIIKGHPQLLKTAFLNLINNGIKFSGKPISIKISCAANNIKISFLDQGIGIPTEDLAYIFQPFYRAKNTNNKHGWGLGLSLTEKIIALHQGKITVESTVNVGTRFAILLPVFKANQIK